MKFLEWSTVENEEIEAHFLSRLNCLQNFRTERIGQRAVQLIGDVCFGFFVFAVLIVTVIAITYKPPDPWLQEQKAYNILFNSVGNSTFHLDDSVLVTGDDLNVSSTSTPLALPPAINATVFDENSVQESCNTSIPWNCSDAGVKFVVEKMNAHHFPRLIFYSYRIVSGGSKGVCDVAWKYRPMNITTPRMYTDFRRFSLVRNSDCSFEVKKIGKWHSGVNARPRRIPGGSENDGNSATFSDIRPDTAFRQGKYLYYTRGADYCKSMGQYTWGLLCALGEARYLNRTFVMDLDVCLSSEYSAAHKDEPGKDFRYYFDLEHLANATSIIEKHSFEELLLKWNVLTERHVFNHEIQPVDLKNDTHSVLYRDFRIEVDFDNHWYRVCEGQAEHYIQRPWNFLWKSKLLMNMVNAICNKLEWDFDVAHVVRGYKAENKKLWPNLDSDTSPENLIAKLKVMIGYRRKLYIATNEPFPEYFDRLREQFEVHVLDDFSQLWAENSEWYNETMRISGKPVNFDGYMKVIIDTEMLNRGKKRVETFNDLTKDCKNGVGRC
ncbi:uncharacterized protein [Physcomitrium patens]|uniref:O-fucosyltransferase family protein n=1 Tax=Physcomitrium patens TaxID=3218 RepID=A9S2L5_PHYPA|nr:uncharacterized protein LOC112287684 [Physcomitrium patens]XP_024386733.1 uncharacterized protein LOC112287684 [Physcomitrium patens]XP_024386742.1 uncharacterized protein LOC112287684 [Physcomitrium patens]XP_024386750.1 uncharacterized protein LOC112287684 [Physcomitrium patens]PNR62448.1 hypothetical protein PHYPA_000872 [Physcomitrium patens]|eukprot:XP_024386726.1 uncharacterized protein LOC112287684 [Physcomitrella patens]